MTPLMFAAALGRSRCIQILLMNGQVDVNQQEDTLGVNAFWFAAYYGRGECLKLLAENGADVLCCNKTN